MNPFNLLFFLKLLNVLRKKKNIDQRDRYCQNKFHCYPSVIDDNICNKSTGQMKKESDNINLLCFLFYNILHTASGQAVLMFLPSFQVSWSGDNPPPFVGKKTVFNLPSHQGKHNTLRKLEIGNNLYLLVN